MPMKTPTFPQFPQPFFNIAVKKLLKSTHFFNTGIEPVESRIVFQHFPNVFHRAKMVSGQESSRFPQFPQQLMIRLSFY